MLISHEPVLTIEKVLQVWQPRDKECRHDTSSVLEIFFASKNGSVTVAPKLQYICFFS